MLDVDDLHSVMSNVCSRSFEFKWEWDV